MDSNAIKDYIDRLTSEYSGIQSVWLIGSRVNNTVGDNPDWDLFVFANKDTLEQLKQNKIYQHAGVDLLIIFDGNNFQSPWPRTTENTYKHGSLDEWGWKLINDNEAQYKICAGPCEEHVLYAPRKEILKANKIWPE